MNDFYSGHLLLYGSYTKIFYYFFVALGLGIYLCSGLELKLYPLMLAQEFVTTLDDSGIYYRSLL